MGVSVLLGSVLGRVVSSPMPSQTKAQDLKMTRPRHSPSTLEAEPLMASPTYFPVWHACSL